MTKKKLKELRLAHRRKRFNILRAAFIAVLLMVVGTIYHRRLGLLAELLMRGAEASAAAVIELLLIAE